MKKLSIIILLAILYSCNDKKPEGENKIEEGVKNKLLTTLEGNSLEDGYWQFRNETSKVSKSGNYNKGLKVGKWKYTSLNESRLVKWEVFKNEGVKLSYPDYLKVSDSVEYPTLFMGDIVDSDNNTYIALLEYNLENMNVSVYDYLYQVNQAIENDTIEVVKAKKIRKYTFNNFELFTANIQVEKNNISYNIVSHVFEVNGYLYDLTYKNVADKISNIDYEVFSEMLYSMECNAVDLFTYNTGQYHKDEEVVFE